MKFYNFLLFSFLILLFFEDFFFPTTITHTHTHDPRPLPTTHDPRPTTFRYTPKSCVVNFDTQMSSSQSEEWSMVFTREKSDTFIQNRERCNVFSHMRKMIRPIRSHRGVWVSRQNSRLFLQLAERRFAHIRGEKFFSKSFFSLKKWKTF